MGVSAYTAFKEAFSYAPFRVLSEAEVIRLGMTPVTTLIDFWEVSKITPDEAARIIIKNAGRGEIYCDNYNAALVERIGADNGFRIDLDYNAASLRRGDDAAELITRLIPYGKNDLPITSVNGVDYVDSPNVSVYGVIEGTRHYDYEDADTLLDRARWEFDPANPERLDIPYVTYEVDLVSTDGLNLGDTVTLRGEKLRVIKMVKYPLEPYRGSVVLGRIKRDLYYYMKVSPNAQCCFSSNLVI